MNILIFSWRDPKHPLSGGAEQVIHEHAKGWIEAGHTVTLFSSRFEGSLKEEEIDQVKVVRGGHQYHLGVQVAGFFYYLTNRNKYELVIDQFHGMPFFTPLYSRKPKVAIVQEVAREVWFLNPLPPPLNLIYGVLGYLLEPFVFLLYRNVHFITGSQSAKEDVQMFGIPKENITIVPHGVLISRPRPFPQKEEIKTLVFLGVISHDKGIEDAIESFRLLASAGTYQFWVIGRAEGSGYLRKIKRRVQSTGLLGQVKFWGYVSQAKKFSLLAKAHILVNPSIREGWGLVNIEANFVGTPVIAYRSPGLVDSVKNGESGLICAENTPQNIASLVKSLLTNRKVYLKLQKGAMRWAATFNWERSRRLSLKVIERIGQ